MWSHISDTIKSDKYGICERQWQKYCYTAQQYYHTGQQREGIKASEEYGLLDKDLQINSVGEE